VLGLSMDQVNTQLAAADQPPPQGDTTASRQVSLGAGGGTPPAATGDKPAASTMTTPDGRVVKLPDGVTEKQVRAIFAKFRSGEQPTPEERAVLQKMRQLNGGGASGRQRPQGNDFQFGGTYVVFLATAEGPRATRVRTGLTDLDYSEVVSGLKAGDSVLVLPSASLINSQQEFKNRIQTMTGGGMPGMRQSTTPSAGGAARPATPAGR